MKRFTWNVIGIALGVLLAQLTYAAMRGWVAYDECRDLGFRPRFCLVQVVLR